MKTGQDYFIEFQKQLKSYNDEELINRFNEEVGNKGWGTARASFLSALHEEFNLRGFDYSVIGDTNSLSFKNKITLINKTIKKIII